MRKLTFVFALSAIFAATCSAFAAISASDNPSGPVTQTDVPGNVNRGFSVAENVSYDPAAGFWEKGFRNAGDIISSGTNVPITETITNVGSIAWTDWHEQVLSTTTVNDNPNYPEFLFSSGSLNVFRNGVPLTQGTDYTLVTDQVFNASPTVADWSTISVFFNPASDIQPGDILQITKQIYEVFGNANVWQSGEVALVAQYPTIPEPASITLATLGVAGLVLLRRSRRKSGR